MSSNPYCERHEWPSNMGMSCPDCAALAALTQKLESAQKDADLWRKQASLDHQQLESVQRELAHWKDCHGVTADKLASTELQNEEYRKALQAIEMATGSTDVNGPNWKEHLIAHLRRTAADALDGFTQKRNDPAPRNGIYHCDLTLCDYMTERKCKCLCEKCVEAKREDH